MKCRAIFRAYFKKTDAHTHTHTHTEYNKLNYEYWNSIVIKVNTYFSLLLWFKGVFI